MFVNLGGPNAAFFEERVSVLIALCPFYVMKYSSFLNIYHTAAHTMFIKLGLMNPYTRFYQASGVNLINLFAFKIGCTYQPMRFFCEIMVSHMATTKSEFTDDERSKVFFGHYPKGSSIRAWNHMYQ